ncbi:NAD-dependent epimerase/dehydratase family protein [candidate division KSB1 bacterium]|nr:NAD-dependent epimerase/dehydratase family protein [candidate division KSB1 bacterium]
MKVFLTGIDGYIGSVLAPILIENGLEVVGLDTGFYRDGWLYNNGYMQFPAIYNKDIRNITAKDLQGVDAVVHLAELSNDPLGQLNPKITFKINHLASVALARRAKQAGVKRFVYTSSCSVYGLGDDSYRTEESETNPLTAYSKCKVLVENDVGKLADENFSPVFLRNATAYGASPRMRFDLVLNNLSGLAWTTKKIQLISDGSPWRPLVHVRDICQAIVTVLNSPQPKVHNQIFNVGDTNENFTVREIAQTVSDTNPGCELIVGESDGDNRSYRVSFDKIHETFPEFQCKYKVSDGAAELHNVFERLIMTENIFQFRPFTRIKQLKYLLNSKQIDNDLFWVKQADGLSTGN